MARAEQCCTNCGSRIADLNRAACPKCRMPIDRRDAPPARAARGAPRGSLGRWLWLVMLLCALGALLAVVQVPGGRRPPAEPAEGEPSKPGPSAVELPARPSPSTAPERGSKPPVQPAVAAARGVVGRVLLDDVDLDGDEDVIAFVRDAGGHTALEALSGATGARLWRSGLQLAERIRQTAYRLTSARLITSLSGATGPRRFAAAIRGSGWSCGASSG